MRSNKHVTIMGAIALALVVSGASHAVSVIDTTGSWNGSDFIFPFGEPNTSTYGQTFTVTGTETVLDSFTFYMDDYLDPDFIDFEAFVYAWDGSKITGSALYTSSAMSSTNNGGADGFEQFTINTGGVNLVSGNQYVAFFSASNLFDSSTGRGDWGGLNGADVYSGGQFVFMNNGSNFGELFTTTWDMNHQGSGSDLAFSMTFSDPGQQPIPEPATMTLLGLGLAGLAARNRRNRKA